MVVRLSLVLAVLLAGAGAAPAQAAHYQAMLQVSVYAPPRVYDFTNTLPVEEFERTRPPTRVRIGGHTRRVYWNNTVIGGYTTTMGLKAARRGGQSPAGVFADRRLTSAERRRFREA